MFVSLRYISRPIPIQWQHRLYFTREVLGARNSALFDVISEHPSVGKIAPRVKFFIDSGVLESWKDLPQKIEACAQRHYQLIHLAASPSHVRGGEASKNDITVLDTVLEEIFRSELCRHSFIVAIGGGAMLDVVGFAAATAHRGINLIRIPTTSLSQADSGVGVKNGVNRFGRKNWLGTFTVPFAVISDAAFLETLPARDRRAGLIEALKVALIRDPVFLDWMDMWANELAMFKIGPFEEAIERSALIHLDHIAGNGDPFETVSSRPLDFGHWSAHKLEQISGFQLGHGEAVAIGMALDLTYAAISGLLPDAERFVRIIERLGFEIFTPLLDDPRLTAGLEEFREHLGGQLTIPMVIAPGEKIDVHDVNVTIIQQSIDRLRNRNRIAP
jgi:3-dehydroquinate synthase